jgi:hypothetical protein
MREPTATTTQPDRAGSRSFPLVISVFGLLIAAGIALGVLIHGRYIAFERTVARHVPGDAAFVIRWDVEKITLFEPTRRYLLPLFDATPEDDGAQARATRRKRVAEASGLDIGRDLREAMALIGPREGDWAVVLGGAFPEAGVLPALERVLAEEGRSVRKLGPDALEGPNGIAVGKASDGVLIVASSVARLRAALPVRGLSEAVPRTGAGALVLRADGPGLSSDVRSVLAELGDVSRIEALASWGSPFVVDVTLYYRDRAPPDALDRARRVLGELMGPGAVPATEIVSAPSPASPRLTVRTRLTDEALERVARRSGDSVYGALWREGRKSAAP